LYFVDVEDPASPGDGQDMPLQEIEHSLTWYVINDGKARMGTAEQLLAQVSGPVIQIGPDSHDWLGVPMLRDGQPGGALVVQSYQPGISFTREDLNLLEFVGSHILTALERKQTKEDLERRVQLRTLQLADANRVLQLEVLERQRAEHLQTALFRIAQLATADIDQDEFYRRVHSVVGELLNAENFFIGLLSDDRLKLTFPYMVDAFKLPPTSRAAGSWPQRICAAQWYCVARRQRGHRADWRAGRNRAWAYGFAGTVLAGRAIDRRRRGDRSGHRAKLQPRNPPTARRIRSCSPSSPRRSPTASHVVARPNRCAVLTSSSNIVLKSAPRHCARKSSSANASRISSSIR
jgi:hypothetical protein